MLTFLAFLAGIALGVWAPRAWKQAAEADRLEALRGRPMPRRRNESGAWFPWGEQ